MSTTGILPTAAQGLQRQASRVEQSAERIASFSAGPSEATSESAPGRAAPSASPPANSALIAAQEAGSPPPATDEGLVTDLVTLRQASHAYKANIAVFEAATELADELLSLAKPETQ